MYATTYLNILNVICKHEGKMWHFHSYSIILIYVFLFNFCAYHPAVGIKPLTS